MIVFPMAGLSRRFSETGYERPKFMLPLRGRTVFEHAVRSFQAYFASSPFLFVVRDEAAAADFARRTAAEMGVADVRVAVLDSPTRGQAETVALGVKEIRAAADQPITVFNIDTFRPGFRYPVWAGDADGYLEVFRGSGANWSYVRPQDGDSRRVAETAEKRPISGLCCTGLYHFASAKRFLLAFDAYAADPPADAPGGELYVAPLYNRLIAEGRDIRWDLVERSEVEFCGTPAEYEALASGD